MYTKSFLGYFVIGICFYFNLNLCKTFAAEPEIIDSGSIKQQFDFVINKSTQYNDYKAVRAIWLGKLKTHSLDTIDYIKTELVKFQNVSVLQSKQIDSLKNGLSQTSDKLATVSNEKNSLRIFGIKIAKAKYNSLVVLIILGLLTMLIFGFLAYKRRNSVAIQNAQDLANLKEEFDMFRKRALEREQKMARQHLDEILKYKNKSVSSGKSGR
jgi:hypothetical protein